jgi:hypothetical protein
VGPFYKIGAISQADKNYVKSNKCDKIGAINQADKNYVTYNKCDKIGAIIQADKNYVKSNKCDKMRLKTTSVYGPSLAGIAGSNPPGGMDVCLL